MAKQTATPDPITSADVEAVRANAGKLPGPTLAEAIAKVNAAKTAASAAYVKCCELEARAHNAATKAAEEAQEIAAEARSRGADNYAKQITASGSARRYANELKQEADSAQAKYEQLLAAIPAADEVVWEAVVRATSEICDRYPALRKLAEETARAVATFSMACQAFVETRDAMQAEFRVIAAEANRLGEGEGLPTLDPNSYSHLAFGYTRKQLGGYYVSFPPELTAIPTSFNQVLRAATMPLDENRYPLDEQVRHLLAMDGRYEKRRDEIRGVVRAENDAFMARVRAKEARELKAMMDAEQEVGPNAPPDALAIAFHQHSGLND